MLRAEGVLAVYNAQVCLWVEDPETKAYLDALWSDGRIRTLVGGGAEAIGNLANAAWQDGYRHVYALRDRDFGAARWPSPTYLGPLFVVDRHEVENYLLDDNAIAASAYNTRRASAADIKGFAEQRAATLVAWMASRHVLREIWSAVTSGFPEDPVPDQVADLRSASAWLGAHASALGIPAGQVSTIVSSHLGKHHAAYSIAAANGTWRTEFSGKEIFGPLVSWIWSTKNIGGSRARSMVAAAVGEQQREHRNVPKELAELRSFLLDQSGLKP